MQLTLLVCLTLLSFFSLLSYPLPSVPCYSHFLLFSIRFFSFSYSISSDYIRMFYKFSSSAFLPSVLASFTFLSCLSLHSLFPLPPPPPAPTLSFCSYFTCVNILTLIFLLLSFSFCFFPGCILHAQLCYVAAWPSHMETISYSQPCM